ncbi:hypothetical protein D9M72_580290 [compost metagenome]
MKLASGERTDSSLISTWPRPSSAARPGISYNGVTGCSKRFQVDSQARLSAACCMFMTSRRASG